MWAIPMFNYLKEKGSPTSQSQRPETFLTSPQAPWPCLKLIFCPLPEAKATSCRRCTCKKARRSRKQLQKCCNHLQLQATATLFPSLTPFFVHFSFFASLEVLHIPCGATSWVRFTVPISGLLDTGYQTLSCTGLLLCRFWHTFKVAYATKANSILDKTHLWSDNLIYNLYKYLEHVLQLLCLNHFQSSVCSILFCASQLGLSRGSLQSCPLEPPIWP